MLPGLFLAYQGLRYIKQEEQRQGQLMLQGLKGTLTGAARKTESDIQKALLNVFDSLASGISGNGTFSPEKINRFLSETPFLKTYFCWTIVNAFFFHDLSASGEKQEIFNRH